MDTMENTYSAAILKKAQALAANPFAVQVDAEDKSVWWVKGSTGSKYRVQIIDEFEESEVLEGALPDVGPDKGLPWLSCGCPNGMNRGGRPSCYHTAAVLLKIEELRKAGKAVEDLHVMTDPNPLNEDFVGEAQVDDLVGKGYTPEEIEFLRG